MTREELREYVEELESQGEIPYHVYSNLIDCIDTLEQESTTKNDLAVDCISRADAIKAMQNKAKKLKNEDTINGLCGAVTILFDLPPVTPIRPKGHWILTDVESNKVWHCHCSECGKDPQDYVCGSQNWWLIKSKLPKFCPSCGADMRASEE